MRNNKGGRQAMTKQIKNEVEVMKIAEVKRINEKLTKRELASLCAVNYNYYINCTTGLNPPSAKMIESLDRYVRTRTEDVYKKVFNIRKSEGRPHESLNIDPDEYDEITERLSKNGVFAD